MIVVVNSNYLPIFANNLHTIRLFYSCECLNDLYDKL